MANYSTWFSPLPLATLSISQVKAPFFFSVPFRPAIRPPLSPARGAHNKGMKAAAKISISSEAKSFETSSGIRMIC
jgi:hypothetical protein